MPFAPPHSSLPYNGRNFVVVVAVASSADYIVVAVDTVVVGIDTRWRPRR